MLATKTTPKDANASQAAGTCTYISRWTSPWLASGGTTTSPSTAVASRVTTVAQPSARWAPRVPIRASALFTSLTEVSSPGPCGRDVRSQRQQVLDQVVLLGRRQLQPEGRVVVPNHRVQVGVPAVVVEPALTVGPQPAQRAGPVH